jgi:hypothetical protein
MRAKKIAVAKVTKVLQNFGIAFAVTAHIASMADNVAPRHPKQQKSEADNFNVATVGRCKAHTDPKKKVPMGAPMRRSIWTSSGVWRVS